MPSALNCAARRRFDTSPPPAPGGAGNDRVYGGPATTLERRAGHQLHRRWPWRLLHRPGQGHGAHLQPVTGVA
ncbi:hypothetical protein [Nannocystis pusilla]|uniref:hypothetical protein n=1 Tax=Nannocystis pusilla TaxID=889268 RepID=UPI003B7FC52B